MRPFTEVGGWVYSCWRTPKKRVPKVDWKIPCWARGTQCTFDRQNYICALPAHYKCLHEPQGQLSKWQSVTQGTSTETMRKVCSSKYQSSHMKSLIFFYFSYPNSEFSAIWIWITYGKRHDIFGAQNLKQWNHRLINCTNLRCQAARV